jgi:hypothetical protein
VGRLVAAGAERAVAGAAVSTMAAMFLSQPAFIMACSISSTVWPRNAFITSGRLIAM